MVSNNYAKAYTEVLALLECLNKEEYEQIPKSEIEFLEKNSDKEYEYNLDKSKGLAEQNISKEANAVLVILFDKYFTKDNARKRLKEILMNNQKVQEDYKKEMYQINVLFDKPKQNVEEIVEYKENVITKFFKNLKNFFNKILSKAV